MFGVSTNGAIFTLELEVSKVIGSTFQEEPIMLLLETMVTFGLLVSTGDHSLELEVSEEDGK